VVRRPNGDVESLGHKLCAHVVCALVFVLDVALPPKAPVLTSQPRQLLAFVERQPPPGTLFAARTDSYRPLSCRPKSRASAATLVPPYVAPLRDNIG